MRTGSGRSAARLLTAVRGAVLTLALATATLPVMTPVSYVPPESPSPSPSPSPTATSSPRPSPSPTQEAEPLPPADDNYWDDLQQDEPSPSPTPSPTPTRRSGSGGAGAGPGGTSSREGPDAPSGGSGDDGPGEIRVDERSGESQGPYDYGSGTRPGLSSRDAFPPPVGGGFGLFTPYGGDEQAPLVSAPSRPAVRPPGRRSTEPVIDKLAALAAPADQVARTLAPFPVGGLASYDAAWTAPEQVPGFERGQGVAIFADAGTPVVAAASGQVVRYDADVPRWGVALELTGPDGTRYRYGHLERVAPAVRDGVPVARGQIIGFVGDTGLVAGGPYLYFQIETADGTILDPLEFLDRWLQEALMAARVVSGLPARDPGDEVAAGLLSTEEAERAAAELDATATASLADLTPLEWLASLAFFGWLGYLGFTRVRRRRAARSVAAPALQPLPLDAASPADALDEPAPNAPAPDAAAAPQEAGRI